MTAVEWLIEQFSTFEFMYCDRSRIIKIAKETERQQIITAFINGDNSDCTKEEDALLYALTYYNETFNK
jgi:hypothetical protein